MDYESSNPSSAVSGEEMRGHGSISMHEKRETREGIDRFAILVRIVTTCV